MASEDENQSIKSTSSSPVESSMESGGVNQSCSICEETLKQPKVLSCLHVFCQTCLEKIIEEESEPVDGEPTKQVNQIICQVNEDCFSFKKILI